MKARCNIWYLKHRDISKPPSIKILRHAHRHTCTPLKVHPKKSSLTSLRTRISLFLYPSAGGVSSRLMCAHDSPYKTRKHILIRKPPPQLQKCTSKMWIFILLFCAPKLSPPARCMQPWHLLEGFSIRSRYRLPCQWGDFWQYQNKFWLFSVAFFFSHYHQFSSFS